MGAGLYSIYFKNRVTNFVYFPLSQQLCIWFQACGNRLPAFIFPWNYFVFYFGLHQPAFSSAAAPTQCGRCFYVYSRRIDTGTDSYVPGIRGYEFFTTAVCEHLTFLLRHFDRTWPNSNCYKNEKTKRVISGILNSCAW